MGLSKSISSHEMNHHIANHFLESLVTLTKERDSVELELTMLKTLHNLLILVGCNVQSIEILRLKEISKLFFNALSTHQAEGANESVFCQHLMNCYNTSTYHYCKLDKNESAHMFPLKNVVAYLNAVVVVKIKGDTPASGVTDAICQLLNVYQNYINLINDNERDTLTGLLNRKTFDNKINRIMMQLNHQDMRINSRSVNVHYLAIFDIDHFKKVNDVHGHLIGDEVLLLFSQLLTKVFRDSDPLFRFGGEEFVALFSCAKLNDIEILLERFKQRLQEFNFPQVGKITASVGYTEIKGDLTPSQYIDRADLALYYAKNNGRNRVCYYEALIEQGLLTEQVNQGDIELF